MDDLDRIRRNAQDGTGPCSGCDAHEKMEGFLVNPGLFDPTSEVVVMTEEPRHLTDWDQYDSWSEYNETWSPRVANARGGKFITELLDPFDMTLYDIWMTDSIKCPTRKDEKRDIPNTNTRNAFNHCQTYLKDEVVGEGGGGQRKLVVTLGAPAVKRTHRALGIPAAKANGIRIKQDYGHSEFDTTPPIVICPHWNAWISRDDFMPVVQEAMADVLQ